MRITLTPASIGIPDTRDLTRAAQEAVEEAIRAGAVMVANDAKRSILNGPKTGHVYTEYLRTGANGGVFPVGPRVPHQASAPGEPPASDTGRLAASIVTDVQRDGEAGVRGVVEARMAYAVYLEYGTRKIAPRPFMLPAFERNRARVLALLRQAMNGAMQRLARKR